MKKIALVFALVGMALLPQTASAASLDSGHSHWDIHSYTDFEFKVCYEVQALPATGFSSEIANLPMREVDAKNNMELRTRQDGFQLVHRINGVATTIVSTLPNPGLTFGTVGQQIMYDFVIQGSSFDLYQLNANGTRGTHWYNWVDTTYPSGVSASYYTIGGWFGKWDFVHGAPINGGAGAPHDISGLSQDARSHTQFSTEVTFDDPAPATGDANSIVGPGSPTFGLSSGTNYTYTITEAGSGTGSFDFRDPGANNNSVFFTSSYYRLRLGTLATIQRYVGSTASTTYTATSGGPGSYTIQMIGPDIYLKNSVGTTILHVNDGGPQSGLRIRIIPSTGQTWSWTGTVN